MASQVKKRTTSNTGNANGRSSSTKSSSSRSSNSGKASGSGRAGAKKNGQGSSGSRSTGSRSTGSRSTGAQGRAGQSAGNKNINDKDTMISNDIKVISGFVIMVLLMLSNFSLTGKAGEWISYFMFGVFGLFAYIFPILMFIGIGFFVANISSRTAMRKLVAAIVMFTMFCTVLQLIYSGAEVGFKLGNIYTECAKIRNGGGILGGIFAVPMYNIIGIYGAYIVTFAVIIICIVVISEKSFVNGVKRHSRNAYDSAKEDIRKMKENSTRRIERKEQNKLKRAKSIVRGVDLNSRVTEEEMVNADVHELLTTGALYRGHIDIEEEDKAGHYEKESNNVVADFADSTSDYVDYTVDTGSIVEADRNDSDDLADNHIDINKIWSESSKTRDENDKSTDVLNRQAAESRDYDIANGEFKPKERITVSKEAQEVMNRKAFDVKPSVRRISNDVPVPNVNEGVKEQPVTVKRKDSGSKSKEYVMPPLNLLRKGNGFKKSAGRRGQISETAMKLQQTLDAFGVKASVINESRGPSVTRYELQPETGTKVSKITSLSDDIKLNLAASDIRIEAPIPGKAAVGIEVPNDKRESVFLRDLIESEELSKHPSKLAFAAGMDIAGKVVVADIAKMPHMLIAGTTGSGKSVFTNSIIMSILFRAKPSEVKLIIVDPKVVEFGVYNGIPHLLTPVVTDPRKAAGALNWAVGEMQRRYKLFAQYNVRDLNGYNQKIKEMNYMVEGEKVSPEPQIVIIIDELADLMMVASKEVEGSICRLAQLARAAGIHLIIATQRPSVDVVTGLIKANIPSRVALLVSSGTDSRTIIDCNGGEKLLGNGDMLFYPSGYVKPVRLQGAFVSDGEVHSVVNFLINNNQDVQYNEEVTNVSVGEASQEQSGNGDGNDKDVLYEQAARFVIEKEKGSTSMLQRMFKIGFNRAARIVEQLEKDGIVGPDEGTKPRKVLMSMEEFENMQRKI